MRRVRETCAMVTVGSKGDGAGKGIRLVGADIDGFAQKLTLEHRGSRHAVRLPLVGEFQIENALVAAGSRSAPAASPMRFSPRSNFSKGEGPAGTGRRAQRRADFCRLRRTSPTRWRRRCRRCGLTPSASSSSCSGRAATGCR